MQWWVRRRDRLNDGVGGKRWIALLLSVAFGGAGARFACGDFAIANWRQGGVSFPARPSDRFWNRDAPIPDVLACPALAAPWPLFCAAAN